MKTQLQISAFLIVSALLSQSALASTIEYSLQSLGGNNYRYSYTVSNDGTLPGGVAIQLFDILFDPSLYDETSLTIASTPALAADWSQQFLASAPSVPAAFDVYANGAGIASGNSANGFAIDFIWTGTGIPGAQSFQIYDPDTFALLETGTTQPTNAVPLPLSFPLFLSGLAGLMALVRPHRHKRAPKFA